MRNRALAAVLLATTLAPPPASAEAPHVAAVAGRVAFHAGAADDIELCTEMTYDSGPYAGRTRYWRPEWLSGNPVPSGRWVDGPVDPFACALALTLQPIHPECPVFLAVDEAAGTDLAGVWQDCEPYEPITHQPPVPPDPEGSGRRCRFTTAPDLTGSGTLVGEADAGPLAFVSGGGTLRCAIYVDGALADAVSAHTV